MLGKASGEHPRVGLSGSGALSHVYIQHPPLRCSVPGARGLYYDDGNKLLLSPASGEVFSWKIGQFALFDEAPSSDPISEGPVVSIRYSLDGKAIGIQRSDHEIEFKNRETGESFSRRCREETESILGFFWTDCPTCDVIFIKTSGLDLFSYEPELKTLRLVETKRLPVSWYAYTHESRMVLLASGMQCKTFYGFQFSSGGLIRLPKFEMTMAKAEANKKPVLAAEDIHIVTIYGRIYCLQVDSVGMLLHLYRFYRDAVVQQGSLPIYSVKIAVSVVDNVLLVHQVDAKVIIVYDIFANSLAPISAPLPLLLRGLSRADGSSSQTSSWQTVNMEATETSAHEGNVYGDSWTFLNPDLICDAAHGTLWRIHLDLEAIAASSSEVPFVLEFLQRRRLESSKAKQLSLQIMRTVILERRPVSMIARAIDVLVSSYSHSVKMGSSLLGGTGNIFSENHVSARGERAPTYGIQHVNISREVVGESRGRVEKNGKSTGQESTSGLENETPNLNEVSRVNKSIYSVSDSEENVNLELLKNNSGEPFEKPPSGNRRGSGSNEGIMTRMGAETSVADVVRSPLQSEVLESSNPLDSNASEHRRSQVVCAAISPDEMYSFVFALVEEEMTGDPSYLVAIIVEYLRSAASEKLKVHQNMYVMTIQLLARNERFTELGLFVINKILEPSKEVALQLLESGRQNFQTRKLGLDMLRHLLLHQDYLLMLVQDGYYLEALRYARKYKVDTIRPSLFLEAAFGSNDSQHLAAVLRFFSDFIPGFNYTSDHTTYSRILGGMS
ncbi:C18orf8 [Tasmannia lanceolata]|uniref:C18orf8 n=1 Tax=Tasmannia lanceolata TaxID=3420 RepID=UPI0040633E9A